MPTCRTCTTAGKSVDIPPPGIVVVVPLDDMNVETGPTEHMFGSHIKMKGIDWANPPDDVCTPTAKIAADVGDVVIFDIRLRTEAPRLSETAKHRLSGALTEGWWIDEVNFKDRRVSS